MEGFVRVFSSTVRQLIFLIVPLSILFLIVRAQIVRVVVGAGAFDWIATIRTADLLAFFALSFVPQALIYLLARAFYALQDTLTPLVIAIVSSVLGIVAAFWLKGPFGVVGLAMAFLLSEVVNAALLWVTLRQRLGSLDEARISRSLLSIGAGAVCSASVMQLLKDPLGHALGTSTFSGIFLQGLIAGGLGLIVYLFVTWIGKSEELNAVLHALKRRNILASSSSEPIAPDTSSSSSS